MRKKQSNPSISDQGWIDPVKELPDTSRNLPETVTDGTTSMRRVVVQTKDGRTLNAQFRRRDDSEKGGAFTAFDGTWEHFPGGDFDMWCEYFNCFGETSYVIPPLEKEEFYGGYSVVGWKYLEDVSKEFRGICNASNASSSGS